MKRACVLFAALALGRAADDKLPHYHDGKMTPYEVGPPSILLSNGDEERLKAGEPLMQAIVQADGIARRLVMVKDVKAPADVAAGRILDLENYPRMVKGCDRTTNYHVSETQPSGVRTIKTKYEIHALHMHFTYFIVHTWDPEARCMVFNLDYDRRSDIDDSVGYWFVQPTSEDECRVFYSCVTKLRGWVPGPVYALMTKQALKQATAWVDVESMKEWQVEKKRRDAQGGLEKLARDMRRRREALKVRRLELRPLTLTLTLPLILPPGAEAIELLPPTLIAALTHP